MNSKVTHRLIPPPTWLRFLAIVVLVIGIFFRFVNLERKIYWYDESFTSLRVSGYKESELIQESTNKQIIDIEVLQKYQHLNEEKSLVDTVNSLALEDAQHPPLYYILMRFWLQWFGDSVSARRSLSVFSSLLVFPSVYWLCWELFTSVLVGWVALALIAVSPLHILYAQEAREYSLWTLTTVLSSAVLLHAMRVQTKLSWGMYASTVILGLYTFSFSAFMIFGHGIYVLAMEGRRFTKTVISFVLASFIGFVAFVPWLLVIICNFSHIQLTTDWLTHGQQWYLVQKWLFNLCTVFFDLDFSYSFLNVFPYLIILLVGYSIYILYRYASKHIWSFILIMIASTALPLVVPDLIFEGQRSGISRFLIPCYLSIQLAVAYLLVTQISSPSISIRQKQLWHFVIVALISAGIVSDIVSSQAKVWWTKYHSYDNVAVASIVNQAAYPLLITKPGNGLAFSYLLNSKVQLQLVVPSNIPIIANNYSDIFLYDSGHELQSAFEKQGQYKLVLIYPPWFWKLIKA
ncbi:glycosyltransferase family 39 protein [Nostoc punctiforme UO1]|uniref:glycosyltransferase family 39 protein n=1 Tax=Nostoc punctiforme TaxID=272131 RepID=UPI00309B8A51